VSISQPYVRPIVRGKLNKPVEFGAKLSVSLRIPVQSCHLFQTNAATHSILKLPLIPVNVATPRW